MLLTTHQISVVQFDTNILIILKFSHKLTESSYKNRENPGYHNSHLK